MEKKDLFEYVCPYWKISCFSIAMLVYQRVIFFSDGLFSFTINYSSLPNWILFAPILRLWLRITKWGGWQLLNMFFSFFHPYLGKMNSPILADAHMFFFQIGLWNSTTNQPRGKMVSPFLQQILARFFRSLLPWIWLFVGAIKGMKILPKYVRIIVKTMIYKDPYQTTKDILDLINVNFIIHPHDFWWAKAPEGVGV